MPDEQRHEIRWFKDNEKTRQRDGRSRVSFLMQIVDSYEIRGRPDTYLFDPKSGAGMRFFLIRLKTASISLRE